MKEKQYYFSHDAHARHDPKIIGIMSIHGTVAYAWYFMMVEMMRETEAFKIPLSKIQQLILCKELNIEMETLNRFVKDCVDLDLFTEKNNFLFSKRLTQRMKMVNEKRRKLSEAGRLGGQASVKHRLSNRQPRREEKRREEKSVKGHDIHTPLLEKNKEKPLPKRTAFIKPTPAEISVYAKELGYPLDADYFVDYYEARGWVVGKSPMKDWKAVMRTWRKRDDTPKKKEKML